MARKRKGLAREEEERGMKWEEIMKEAEALGEATRAKKRFVGVRQRPSGRWVAEIKDTIHKIRVWLGTFDTAEEAARAYDEAACLLRGANTRTNFWPCTNNSTHHPALSSKITNLLLQRLKAKRNNTPCFSSSSFDDDDIGSVLVNHQEVNLYDDEEECADFPVENFIDFLNDPEEYIPITTNSDFSHLRDDNTDHSTTAPVVDHSFTANLESCSTENNVIQRDEEESEEEINHLGVEDFEFLDNAAPSCYYYSAFEIDQEMEDPLVMDPESYGDEPSMLRASMKRMKYERKFSASLYAFNGIPECLKLKLGSANLKGRGVSDHLTNLRMACDGRKKFEENKEENGKIGGMERKKEEENPQTLLNEECYSSSSSVDGEVLLWNSLDLPPICYVN